MQKPIVKEIRNAVIIEPMIQPIFMVECGIYSPVHAEGGLIKLEQAA